MYKKEELYSQYRHGQISKEQLVEQVSSIDFPKPSAWKLIGMFLLSLLFPFLTNQEK